ncbi:MAG: nucleotidyl transferase AbiEii/AbiGii toxin family protein [Candidatus Electryonea clarkiae]|nr:nucleotidyl transferase AbiEii/AbiGii toxin family protein [Candidatus Electryonea clarkiae]
MNSAINSMLQKYQIKSLQDSRNALKEIIQEIALLGLYRSGFYTSAAFYGGSALRIFYGLNRFSEDLDFSLITPDKNFDFNKHLGYVDNELGAYGLKVKVAQKSKSKDSDIKSAFVKGNTIMLLLEIGSITKPVTGIQANESVKIKLEIDTNPPPGAEYEVKYQLNPVPYSVRLYSPDSLFAGKLHAILSRSWKSRVKGRDFYDYVWYLSQNIAVNLTHLENRLKQSGHFPENEVLTKDELIKLLLKRFQEVDFQQAKSDVLPFIKDPQALHIWSQYFFVKITQDKLTAKIKS